jgi:enamine deaminase RidA (YjgF/YER057c/UK114 family)
MPEQVRRATMSRVTSPDVPEPGPGLWSNCLRVGDAIYVSGLVATGPEGVVGIEVVYAQAHLAFTKIRYLLQAAGATMDDIVKLTIFVTRIDKSAGIRRARSEFFSGDFPASSMVEVSRLGRPELLVEIEAVAVAGRT